ncbi:cytochrome d ubiquinol oxidase subunit II [Nocardioides bruguierae]|uniref:Cytochrome d ubiquinol oxidase subunit II n=1 Tax=Nocardioides bruguierae TaxID=2945102 RepID=A0A9X2D6F6_9ACTN|nr:cytochrome d ubiquinol oxidase subunit II [Nocardioides bruguierae]MCM0620247.1 cytochrome d ubiquinol oxidase subunit II [Nocardioides bruguierae]
MSLEVVVAAALFAGVLFYAVLGGADFGSGFYDLTAGGSRSGARIRRQVDHSIGPVWEANHVWLIYVLVVWWTAFPSAYEPVMRTLIVPLFLAVGGIVLRGSAFAFRKYAESLALARFFGVVFAVSSVITPFFLGAVAGAIASGRVPAEGRGDLWASWLNPTSVIGGLVAIGTCAFLAGVFLVADATRGPDADLAASLRRRVLAVGIGTGAIVLAGLIPLHDDAPTLWYGLTHRALPLVIASAVLGAATLVLLWVRRPGIARFTAVGAVAAVVSGWGMGQYPWFLVDEITITDAAGATATLEALLVAVGLAAALVGPSLGYLLHTAQKWSAEDAH